MNRIEDYEVLKNRIVRWIKDYADSNGIKSLVVGVSGGIDSAVTSTLAAETGLMTYCIGMPLLQKEEQESLSDIHLDWLGDTYWDTKTEKFDLSNLFEVFRFTMRKYGEDKLALANTRARLRMATLYQVAQTVGGIDSAVTSTLAAETGLMTYCIGMPLLQKEEQESLSDIHLDWLGDTYWDTKTEKFDLSNLFEVFRYTMRKYGEDDLALANTRARLRMATLYQVAKTLVGSLV